MNTSIPFLPGYTKVINPRTDYKKSHVFDIGDGIRTTDNNYKETRTWRPVNTEADLSIAHTSADFDRTQTMKAGPDNTLRREPAWVAYDRKVLRFFAYFKEAVFSSPAENYRLRNCVIYYYLEDHSIHVAEPKQENSGIPQGVFIKRHRIPKANNEYVCLDDLMIGGELLVYGRVFRIYDVDDFTRQFFNQNGVDMGPPEEVPRDPFAQKTAAQPVNNKKIMYPMKEHMEASLGKMMGVNIESTQRFLKNDRKVLRFYCLDSDTRINGEQRPFVCHYFLADDTVEVLEINMPNCGRDAFPVFCNRAKLPKDFNKTRPDVSRIGWTTDKSVQYHTEVDFRVGSEIEVYGRKLFICGCDNFTKEFYIQNFGMPAEAFDWIALEDPEPERPTMLPPTATGYGTEEDSLGSFLFLMPKVPKIDFKKWMENDGKMLQFSARMVDPKPEDVDRRFNIKFFLNDNTVLIFEKFMRNSGFIGGKFLERSRQKNPETGMFFAAPDFVVGKNLVINGTQFELLESDMWSQKFMAANPEVMATF